MIQTFREPEQEAFAHAVANQLRAARMRQRITQTQLAKRTGGRVSKAALANYETKQRSLRVDVFWVLARALGEDPGAMLLAAERESGYGVASADAPISVNTAAIQQSDDPRLVPVQRWFTLRLKSDSARDSNTLVLDVSALRALAALMGTNMTECRRILRAASEQGDVEASGADAALAAATPQEMTAAHRYASSDAAPRRSGYPVHADRPARRAAGAGNMLTAPNGHHAQTGLPAVAPSRKRREPALANPPFPAAG